MIPDHLGFLNRFDDFYNMMINEVKENKIDEKNFYMLVQAKAKSLDRERKEERS